MEDMRVKVHIGQNGILTLDVPQFRDIEVEVVIRQVASADSLAIFDIPSLEIPATHPALTFMSRETLYDDDGR